MQKTAYILGGRCGRLYLWYGKIWNINLLQIIEERNQYSMFWRPKHR